MQDLITEFMSKKNFAVVGATDNPEKYGNRIVKNLAKRGYRVFPVNPKLDTLEGLTCYHNLAEIPEKVEVVDFVVPPAVTLATLKQCRELGLTSIWLQRVRRMSRPGFSAGIHGMQVVHGVCVMLN
jgi:predicted CoA-binding protein